MSKKISFVESLQKGDADALRRFYSMLVKSGDDHAFWETLKNMAEKTRAPANLTDMDGLRRTTRQTGCGYETFVKHSPKSVVLSFLLAAMLFSGCSKGTDDQGAKAVVVPIAPSIESPQKLDAGSAAPSPAASPIPEFVETQKEPGDKPPSSDEIRSELLEYISRAQLPAREKREMKKVVRKSVDSEIIDTQGDLEKLLETKNPRKIAKILEATALLKSVAKKNRWKPSLGVKYKAASFEWDDV